MSKVKLMLGDNISSLKKLPDNSIDSIVSDPPYGLSFMGKKWDYDVPSVEFWKEVYRVLKPGGHVLSFGGTRTYHRMTVNIEDAGFEIRDQIMWLYGSGFPKSHNIGKSVDKIQGNEREVVGKLENYQDKRGLNGQANVGENAKPRIDMDITKGQSPWEGWGTALKPANEPICVARKPLSEKSVAENVLKWGTGGINIDGCRVGTDTITTRVNKGPGDNGIYGNYKGMESDSEEREGRFPANIILECICDEVIKGDRGEVKKSGFRVGGKSENSVGLNGIKNAPDNYNDKGDIHTNPMCPCLLLDEQSGFSKSNCKSGVIEGKDANVFNDGEKKTSGHKKKMMVGNYSDKGGASRFFYQAKVSKKERNMGLDHFEDKKRPGQSDVGLYSSSPYCIDCGKTVNGTNDHTNCVEGLEYKPSSTKTKNSHPTVKPVSLMAYLCRLITPPGGIVLDPFMGSGSTGIAAGLEGFKFCGMEMDENYFKIAEARINDFEKYREFLKK